MKKIAILFFITMLALSACKPKELSQQDKTLITNLNTELNLIKEDLVKVLADIDKYEGGLIKDLLVYRSQILKTNEALIQQRIHAIESGAPVTIEIKNVKVDQKKIDEIQQEINRIKEEIKLTESEAENYSGGMIKVTLLANVAAQKTSLSMLESQYLAEKFDIQAPFASRSNNEDQGKVNADVQNAVLTENKSAKQKIEPKIGPFGLEMGMSVSEVEELSQEKLLKLPNTPNAYLLNEAPKPNSNFNKLYLHISENVGLCSITAVSKEIKSDRNGIILKAQFMELKDVLVSNYGDPTLKVDDILPGALYNKPEDWMDALSANERRLFVRWDSSSEKPIKNNIKQIALIASADGLFEGSLTMQYNFTNSNVCEEESLNMQKDGL